MNVTVIINQKQIVADVDENMLLVDFIREVAGLKATNIGCDTSTCGACTVLLNGQSVKSCTILAVQADKKDIVTLEGVSESEGLIHPVVKAFSQCHGLQCGFCTSGMVMAAISLLSSTPNGKILSEEEIRQGLEGNLCRCTGYNNIVNAISVAQTMLSLEL
jgi:carbon-monoxide dehydrogenase small subunit